MNKLSKAMLTTLATLALVLTNAALSPAAHAEGAGPQLLTPTDGATVPVGFTGPITLDTTGTTAGTEYALWVRCHEDTFSWNQEFTADTSTSRVFTMGQSVPEAGSCLVEVTDVAAQTSNTLGHWTVLDTLALTAGRTNHPYFYPRVRDGYRDDVVTAWHQNIPADATVRVLNSRGTTVRTASVGDARRWTWNGKGSNGRAVAVGKYRIKVSVQDPNFDHTPSFTTSVSVRSRTITERHSQSKLGHRAAVGASSSCFVTKDPDFDLTTTLDCWGGRYARAKYTFSTPVSARSVSYHVTGSPTGADICCNGKIKKSGKRAKNKRSYAVTVRVNGWRAYEIRRVKVAYSLRVRQ